MGLLVKSILSFFIVGIGLLILFTSLKYFNPDFSRGFLIDKKDVFKDFFGLALYTHIFTSPVMLFIGTGLVFFRLEKYIRLHRLLGYVYLLHSPFVFISGLIMSFYAFGGTVSKISFVLLSCLLMYFTVVAFIKIKKREVIQHKQFMTRSYILVLSAVNLRLLSYLFVNFFNWEGAIMYTVVAILSWVPFLISYEIFIYKKTKACQD